MSFCLPKEFTNKFIDALKSGKIDPAKLIDMTSAERRAFLSDIVGKDNVHEVNALLESKLLLKDQKRGLVSWAKKVSGISEATRTDILSKIERITNVLDAKNEDVFLEDLASKKLGADVTFEEATKIVEGSKAVEDAKTKWNPDKAAEDLKKNPNDKNAGWESEDARLEYGLKYTQFQKYVSELKSGAKALSWKEWITSPSEIYDSVASNSKSILASLDNSFFGRQGISTLYTNPDIWIKNFAKSWVDIGRELVKTKSDVEPMDILKSDIYSRPNAVNGKYHSMKLDIGIASEEAFPSSFPERIPIFGRLFKASETAFNGGAMRMRADLADRIIPKAESYGVDMSNPDEAKLVGQLINSLTGRGKVDLPQTGPFSAKNINNSVFSVKFLKSNFDKLFNGISAGPQMATDALLGIERTPAERFVRKQAATNLLKITATTAAILYTANQLNPGSVDFDPRSTNFGKIKVGGGRTIDVTGGLGAVLSLAARITPTTHNGKLGFWYKSKNGVWTQLNDPKYGQQSAVDVIENFGEGKLSPIAGMLRDFYQGQDYNGNKVRLDLPSLGRAATGLVTPIPIQNALNLEDPQDGFPFGLMIMDGLGFSVGTTPKKK